MGSWDLNSKRLHNAALPSHKQHSTGRQAETAVLRAQGSVACKGPLSPAGKDHLRTQVFGRIHPTAGHL